jgi:hypothetical protein
MRRGDNDRDWRRPSLPFVNFGGGRLMTSGERKRAEHECENGRRRDPMKLRRHEIT